jgi:hypothetical protein
MATNTLESLSFEDVGNPGWNPTCLLSQEGFRYWFPALVRIACEDQQNGYWEDLFGFFLRPDHGRQQAFHPREQGVILQIFDWLLTLRGSEPRLGVGNWESVQENARVWRAHLAA